MPVGTQGTVKAVAQDRLENEIDAPIILGKHLSSTTQTRNRDT